MKYILLFCGTRDGSGPASSPDDVRRTYADVGDWLTRSLPFGLALGVGRRSCYARPRC